MIAPHAIRRIAWNAVSVSGGEVANKASTFLVYAAISRIIGLEAFGQLSLAMTLLYTFHVFGFAGLPTVLIRLVAKRPKTARFQLYHGYLASLFTSAASSTCMIALAYLMGYQSDTRNAICLLALAVPFYSLTMIAESIIKGRERMHYIPIANLPGNILFVLGSLSLLWFGFGVLWVAGVVIVSRILTLIGMHLCALKSVSDARDSKIFPAYSFRLLRDARVFLSSDGVAAIGMSLFGLMLSKFATEREVGMLNASFQLLQPIQILYRSVGHSSFPPLVAAAKSSKQAVADLVGSILGLIVRLAFPACIFVFGFAGEMLDLVYGHKGFRDGAVALQIIAFTLLMDPLNPVLGHGLWAVGADKTVLRIVITNVSLNLLFGLILIGQFGLVGAAVCALIASSVNTLQHYLLFRKHVGNPSLVHAVSKLLPAIMAAVAVVLVAPWSKYISLPLAAAVYASIVFLISNQSTGWKLTANRT